MKKLLFLITLFLAFILSTSASFASDSISESSAKLAVKISVEKDYTFDTRAKAVRNIFKKYNSALSDQAAFYVKYADEFGVDWRLLPSIAGLESTFGKFLMPGSYNAYGWGGGYIYFDSWEDGIKVINKALRENYMDKWGATDVWSIGPIYAESPTWSVRVNYFMNVFDQEYKRLTVFSVIPSI